MVKLSYVYRVAQSSTRSFIDDGSKSERGVEGDKKEFDSRPHISVRPTAHRTVATIPT